jgi:uncharacterized membrane protein YphA (DoxX/SURF4 family)
VEAVAASTALLLAGVLAWAAVGKLRDPAGTREGFDRLGLPAPGALARAVPVAELAVAGLLVVAPPWGGTAAFVLLAGFTAYLVDLVRSGRSVPCGCFGSSGQRPVSAVELVRNGLLLLGAAVVVSSGDTLVIELAAVIAVSAAAATAAVVLALVAVKVDVGTVWSVRLAGEEGRR